MRLSNWHISMVVAAAITVAAFAPSTGWAYSINADGTLTQASGGDTLLFPIYTTASSTGTTAVTSFSVTNTSDSETVLAKIRFREQMNCVDALDFHIVLSPNDKFDFWVDQVDGRPAMKWRDNTCVIGPQVTPDASRNNLRIQPFPEAWAPFVANDDDLDVGHVEVLGLVNLASAPSLAAAARHNSNGVPANCALLQTVFGSPSQVFNLNTASQENGRGYLRDAGNVLVGRYIIQVPGVGLEAAGDAIAIRDGNLARPRGEDGNAIPLPSATRLTAAGIAANLGVDTNGDGAVDSVNTAMLRNSHIECDPNGDGTFDVASAANRFCGFWNQRLAMWHVTSQSSAACGAAFTGTSHANQMFNCRSANFNAATGFASNGFYSWDAREWDHPHLGELQNFRAFQQALQSNVVAGDWSNNPDNNVGFDWVFSFPTKYVYLDRQRNNGTNECPLDPNQDQPWQLMCHPPAREDDQSDGIWFANNRADNPAARCANNDSCTSNLALTTSFDIYDTEEGDAGNILSVSPGFGAQLSFNRCVNIFTIAAGNQEIEPSYIQTEARRHIVNIEDLNLGDVGGARGWALLGVNWPQANPATGAGPAGAATGLVWTIRATADPDINNSSLSELQKNVTR